MSEKTENHEPDWEVKMKQGWQRDADVIVDELLKPAGERLYSMVIATKNGENIVYDTLDRAIDYQKRFDRENREPVGIIHNGRLFVVDVNRRDKKANFLDPNGEVINFNGEGFQKTTLDDTALREYLPDLVAAYEYTMSPPTTGKHTHEPEPPIKGADLPRDQQPDLPS